MITKNAKSICTNNNEKDKQTNPIEIPNLSIIISVQD